MKTGLMLWGVICLGISHMSEWVMAGVMRH